MSGWPYNTANWKRLRKAHLSAFPWCEGCERMGRRYVLANTVDHRVPISDGGPAFPGHDGLASYCGPCHSAKTARGTEAGAVQSSKPRRGCDAEGNPLDPAHPWRRTGAAKCGGSLELSAKVSNKSLRAEPKGPPPHRNTQLIAKGSQNGR